MPRYDYRCTICTHEFELVQSFSEAGSGVCPECSGPGQRVYHAVPVIYKGSGFYTTDYGRPKPPAENGSKDSKETKATESDSSSDSKEKVSATPSSSSTSDGSSSTSDSSSSGNGSSVSSN